MKKGYVSASPVLFAALVIFGGVTAVFNVIIGVAELIVVFTLYIIYRRIAALNRDRTAKMVIESAFERKDNIGAHFVEDYA